MIHTPTSLRIQRRRVDRRLVSVQGVLHELENGAALHVQFARHGRRWTLSTGRQVDDDVAQMVIGSASVIGCGDALFEGVAAQTYRWWK